MRNTQLSQTQGEGQRVKPWTPVKPWTLLLLPVLSLDFRVLACFEFPSMPNIAVLAFTLNFKMYISFVAQEFAAHEITEGVLVRLIWIGVVFGAAVRRRTQITEIVFGAVTVATARNTWVSACCC